MTSPVLVLVDHHDGVPRSSGLELLTVARDLGPVEAVCVGEAGAQAAPELGRYGAGALHVLTPGTTAPAALAGALARLVDATGAATVLMSSTFENKELAAHLALLTDAGLVVDAAGLEPADGGRVVTVQQAFAATWTLRGEVLRPCAVVALKPNAVPAAPADTTLEPTVTTHDVDVSAVRERVVERTPRPTSDRPDLTEAQVVVVGGRGTEGDFSAVEELADVLGAAVGATRVATDEGWIGHEAQIGQTGVTVSPRLYVGAGVSGAVHHRGGMQASGTIVAVNADPEAPIFEIADLGVVGDLFTVLPQAAAELRRLRSEG